MAFSSQEPLQLTATATATATNNNNNTLPLPLQASPFQEHCHADQLKKTKKKMPRVFGWGLRRFSTIVCEKIETKGRTTYKKVSEEILSEINRLENGSQRIEFDEKNLRRRIYDAFNVLESIGVIARDKKEVWWIGFPHSKSEYVQRLQKHRKELLGRIQKKMEFLQEIEDQTSPLATLEIDISEDTHMVHFEFNGTPFMLHDDASVLKAMRFQAEGRPENVNPIILDSTSQSHF